MSTDLNDNRYGHLTYDSGMDWWIGELPGDPAVEVTFLADEDGSPDAALATGHAIMDELPAWMERIASYAVQELLSLKNSDWRESDEPVVTPEVFRERMRLEGITFYPHGSFEFFHEDGDLFWGHCILVSGDPVGGPTSASLAG